MSNYASEHQLIAVAEACNEFSAREGVRSTMSAMGSDEISCRMCEHWDGKRCVINVFDTVLTSLDQT